MDCILVMHVWLLQLQTKSIKVFLKLFVMFWNFLKGGGGREPGVTNSSSITVVLDRTHEGLSSDSSQTQCPGKWDKENICVTQM